MCVCVCVRVCVCVSVSVGRALVVRVRLLGMKWPAYIDIHSSMSPDYICIG